VSVKTLALDVMKLSELLFLLNFEYRSKTLTTMSLTTDRLINYHPVDHKCKENNNFTILLVVLRKHLLHANALNDA